MSEKVEIDKTLIKLKENNYDLTELTSTELETLLKYSPEIIKAITFRLVATMKRQKVIYFTMIALKELNSLVLTYLQAKWSGLEVLLGRC